MTQYSVTIRNKNYSANSARAIRTGFFPILSVYLSFPIDTYIYSFGQCSIQSINLRTRSFQSTRFGSNLWLFFILYIHAADYEACKLIHRNNIFAYEHRGDFMMWERVCCKNTHTNTVNAIKSITIKYL